MLVVRSRDNGCARRQPYASLRKLDCATPSDDRLRESRRPYLVRREAWLSQRLQQDEALIENGPERGTGVGAIMATMGLPGIAAACLKGIVGPALSVGSGAPVDNFYNL